MSTVEGLSPALMNCELNELLGDRDVRGGGGGYYEFEPRLIQTNDLKIDMGCFLGKLSAQLG